MRTLLIPAAAAAFLAASSLVFAATQTQGMVKSYDGHTHMLTLADGSTYTLKKGVKAPALKAGEKVTVLWSMDGSKKVAEKVTVTK